jgi:hypothetical protein
MISHPAEVFLNVTFCIDILDSYILLDCIKKKEKRCRVVPVYHYNPVSIS